MELIKSGKVRDIFEYDSSHLLIRTTDRVSAFDKSLGIEIEGKGEILTKMSNFWFNKFSNVPNHLSDIKADNPNEIIVKKLNPIPIEAIVRGFIIGSGWKDYQQTGKVCEEVLPENLKLAEKLPMPLFTPSTKAEKDENISFSKMASIVGSDIALKIKKLSLSLYLNAFEHALDRGIIIADTKFEFGLDENGVITLMDEVLTPDSSRFWSSAEYIPGLNPLSYDKQPLRDFIKENPNTPIPQSVLDITKQKYQQAFDILTL